MKNLATAFLLPSLLLLAPTTTAQQRHLEHGTAPSPERRIALVIGNGNYKLGPLKNPINDARAMAVALRELGFEVIHGEDLNREDMRRAIREFGAKIGRGGVGLFYYAGHGVQVRGENYLIPVDAAPESADEVDDDGVNVGYVIEKMEGAGNGMNIVILDACRNNPFTRSFRSGSDGLASVSAPVGTLIAYATAPGAVAGDGGDSGNGVYTQELLKILKTPGLGIEEVFKRVRIAVRRRTQGRQTPWESSSLVGDFYFSAVGRRNTSPAKGAEAVDAEASEWEKVRDSADPEVFKKYLAKYPQGQFAGLARTRLDSLNSPAAHTTPGASPSAGAKAPAPPPTAPPAFLLTKERLHVRGVITSVEGARFVVQDFYGGSTIVYLDETTKDTSFGMSMPLSSYDLSRGKHLAVSGVKYSTGELYAEIVEFRDEWRPTYTSFIEPKKLIMSPGSNGFELSSVYFAPVRGNLSEIRDKRKVYVSAYRQASGLSFPDTHNLIKYASGEGIADADVKDLIIKKLREYRGVEVVDTPEASDFIIYYAGVTPYQKIVGDMVAVVRGEALSDGAHLPRVIWKENNSRTSKGALLDVMSRHPADNMTRHFIDALKKLRGEK